MLPGMDMSAMTQPATGQAQHVDPLVLGLVRHLVETEQKLARTELLFRQREHEHTDEAQRLRARIAELESLAPPPVPVQITVAVDDAHGDAPAPGSGGTA